MSTKRPTAKKARAPRKRKTAEKPTADAIAYRAYMLHLDRPGAGELENWLDAERELASAK